MSIVASFTTAVKMANTHIQQYGKMAPECIFDLHMLHSFYCLFGWHC